MNKKKFIIRTSAKEPEFMTVDGYVETVRYDQSAFGTFDVGYNKYRESWTSYELSTGIVIGRGFPTRKACAEYVESMKERIAVNLLRLQKAKDELNEYTRTH